MIWDSARAYRVFLVLTAVWLTGCGAQPLLMSLDVQPQVITPNGDGKDDVAEVKYSLSSGAAVTVTLLDSGGKAYLLRSNQPRSPGDYNFLFGGVVGGVALPNGSY